MAITDTPPAPEGPWKGKGAIRARPLQGGGAQLEIDAVTSQTRRYKALAGSFLRKEARWLRPSHAGFVVRIDIERMETGRGLDVDNVAKAVLDALSGTVFYDDSQVDELHVARRLGERSLLRVWAWPGSRSGPRGAISSETSQG